MPSLKSNKNKWSLPANPSPVGVRCINVAVPDDAEWIAKFYGQIYMLSQQIWWDRDDAHTAKDVAAVWLGVYLDTLAANNCSGVPCEVPADPDLGIDILIRIIRRGVGGFTEELIDGVWQTPEGDYEVPPVPVREEPDRLCLAAANAANVLAIMYEEITDAWSIEHTKAAVFGAIFDIAVSLIGAFAGATAAAYASLGKTFFDAFVETVDTLAADVWTAGFTDELTCLLYEYATDTSGVITFDWEGIRGEITNLFVESGAAIDTDRALLWGQVGYLFDVLAAGGINHAGTTTAITSYDCDGCGDWCRNWNLGLDPSEFQAVAAGWADYIPSPAAGAGWNGNNHGAGSLEAIWLKKEFGAAIVINHIVTNYDKTAGSGANNIARVQLWNGASLVFQGTTNPIGLNVSTEYFPADVTADRIVWDINTGSSAGTITIEELILGGPGSNPFGIDNCE